MSRPDVSVADPPPLLPTNATEIMRGTFVYQTSLMPEEVEK
jgi:hypothetical protein